MAVRTAARRYADAAFELARETASLDTWQRDLRLAGQLAQDEQAARAADSPAVPFEQRRRLVEEFLASRVSKPVLNLGLLLAQRERFYLLPQISERYDELLRRSRGEVDATVTSAAPLDAEELAAVRRRIEELAGGNVELETAVDPALIGGVTVRIGDRLIDASVRGRLQRLRERLVQGTA